MSNTFEALWQPAAGFEALDVGAPAQPGPSFKPMSGFDAPAPDPDFVEDDDLAGTSLRSGEFSASLTGEHEPVQDPDLPSDVALLKAREEAFEIGRAEGLEAGRVEVEQQLARVADLLEQVDGARKELMARSVEDLAAIVMHVSQAIVGRELAVDSDGVETLVKSIFEDVRSDDEVIVRVSEEDSWMMREAYPALLEMVGRDGEVRILVDPTLKPGGAIVETSHGTIDASISAQFASFAAEIEAWAGHEVEAHDD